MRLVDARYRQMVASLGMSRASCRLAAGNSRSPEGVIGERTELPACRLRVGARRSATRTDGFVPDDAAGKATPMLGCRARSIITTARRCRIR